MSEALRRSFVNLLFLERVFAYETIYEFFPLITTDGNFCINKQVLSDSYTETVQRSTHVPLPIGNKKIWTEVW